MSEFENLFGDNFFIIDSDNLDLVESKLFGFAIFNGEILQNENFNSDRILDGNGTYIQIIKSENKISIYQDFNGSFGIYLFEDEGYFAISNSFIKLVDYIKDNHLITLNKDYAKYFISVDLCSASYSETLVNEIRVLPKNFFVNIDLNSKSISTVFIDYKEQSISLNSKEGIEILDNWFYKWIKIFRKLKSKTNNLSFHLSGGFDSRLSLTLLLASKINLDEILIYSIDDEKHTHKEDFEIASQIADYFGFKLNNNTITSNRVYFKEIETPVNISFYTKLGIHKQMFYTYSYKLEPVYSITGYGGECIREYWKSSPLMYIDILSNRAKNYSQNLVESSQKIVKRSFSQLSNDLKLELSSRLLYNQTRSKNHFGKLSAEFYISNLIKLSPLLDLNLHKLKLIDEECSDNNLLISLMFVRYCPDLLNFKFDNNRFIDEETIKHAIEINKKYPFKKPNYDLVSNVNIEKSYVPDENSFKKGDAEKYVEEIFFSDSFKKSFELQFSSELYYKIFKKFNSLDYFPLEDVYAAIAVIKICDDVNYSYYRNSNKLNFCFNNPLMDYDDSNTNDFSINHPLLKFNTARIDIKNYGGESNKVEIINISDFSANVDYPEWFHNQHGWGMVIHSKKNFLDIKLKCIGEGYFKIQLKGVDARTKSGQRLPIYINYNKFLVNNDVIFEDNKILWHDEGYSFGFGCKNGDVIDLYIEWKPF